MSSGRTDASRAGLLQESIKRENRALFNFLRGQAVEELSDPASSQWESNAPEASTSRPAVHLKAAAAHVTSAGSATAALSRHLWASVNPGYAPTDTSKQLSVQRADYVWDAAEVAYMRELDTARGRYNRRRNDISDHHAALVKFQHLTKPAGGGRKAAA